MQHQTEYRPARRRAAALMLTAALLLVTSSALGQQTNVTRFDTFVGYTLLDSPQISLFENGFQFQIGVRPTTWYSLGFDYSLSAGDLTLTPNLLTDKLQAELGALLGPAAAELSVGAHSRTQTFAAGPQLAYRHFQKVTLFLRPNGGIIKELATAKPVGALATGVVGALEQSGLLQPSGQKRDWTEFYGFGGGIDFLVNNHFGLRVQGDLVRDHLFDDLLKNPRWTARFSVGPIFNFGKNIAKTK
ncbi:MAG: hypothetical protein ACLQOO_02355 [Terriglobia bacterium]